MLTNICELSVMVNGKRHAFLCDSTASTIENKEALCAFLKYVGNAEDHVRQQRELAEQAVVDESTDESKIESIEEKNV